MNQIREAAMRIQPFHLGSTAIVIIIATNGVLKVIEKVRLGFIRGKYCDSCILLLNLLSYMRAYKHHAGAMFRGILNGSWRCRVASVEG